MTTEYRITLIPIPLEGDVTYKGINYTTSANKINIELDGQKFYVRENNSDRKDLLREALSASLEQIIRMIKPSAPVTISLTLEEEE
ncbi:MAG: hypothetical protein AABW75_02010 [Nanoarchaeota archaeon]